MTPITDAASLGAAILRERRRQGLTQGELAQYAGVGINFVSQVERGKETAEVGKVLALLGTLGLVVAVERRDVWRRSSTSIASAAEPQGA